ncbi:MAG TPA: hypothetical protein VLB02_01280 [Candidatus Paceibacterota bacterium]|nr:hypothetical protein [Candidatus Paceibacterota bacterium]
MNKKNSKKKYPTQAGFAMLFTVLLISLVLSLALGISNITYKQTILSSLAKDSQIAFYQADAGAECGLYYDFTLNAFPEPSTFAAIQSTVPTITCGTETLTLDPADSSDDDFVYRSSPASPSNPCYNVVFDKTGVENIIQAYGYNICDQDHPRQVERALQVRY